VREALGGRGGVGQGFLNFYYLHGKAKCEVQAFITCMVYYMSSMRESAQSLENNLLASCTFCFVFCSS
jgi:hypothetical protein